MSISVSVVDIRHMKKCGERKTVRRKIEVARMLHKFRIYLYFPN